MSSAGRARPREFSRPPLVDQILVARAHRSKWRLLGCLGAAVLIATSPFAVVDATAQVYGYTNENGVLILSNVLSDTRMRLIADGTAEEAGKVWHYNGQYDPLILKASQTYGVDSALVRSVMAVESAFNRFAQSHKGARGLMQLMPATARQYGVENVYDPWQNIRAGTAHLRGLIDEFRELHLALAAYNAGATPVRRYGTIPPYPETRNYVRKVMAIYRAGSKIEIVKGSKVYSIDRPGGTARITAVPQPSRAPGADARTGSPLADLARQVGRSRFVPARSAQVVLAATNTNEGVETSVKRRVYYRYLDPEGVIRISRTPPTSHPYEVLDP
ncbi:MAG TPA: lytic transglycosylase domain-containing protein [Vicinamibacteria bacterium]|nr:lytic transglycosylase domain-containing protein [Vicinamibacteria bacterium]